MRPGSVEEVSRVLAVANAARVAIVPQGGNTGLVGGQIPDESCTTVVLSLERLNKIRHVDSDGSYMTVEAGVVLETIHQKAQENGFMFPLTLGSQGSCQIGGNVSTNAGGTAVLAFGNTRELILGLEVVFANGEVWNGLRTLRKDNTGYDLKQLFIGSEGTLGIITAANIRMFPQPNSQELAFVGLESPWKALELFKLAFSQAGTMVTGFELIPRIGIEFALRHLPGAREPLESAHTWYALLEISSGGNSESTRNIIETIYSMAMENEILQDAVLAENTRQQNEFWRIRHGLSDVQRPEGGSIKHDISVPVAKVPEFLERATEAVVAYIPGCRPFAFGHLGDGNIHFNISQPVDADKQEFLSNWDKINSIVHEIVITLGGSISAEHGIGKLKRKLLRETKSELEIEMMQKIKTALDPNGILNPGSIL